MNRIVLLSALIVLLAVSSDGQDSITLLEEPVSNSPLKLEILNLYPRARIHFRAIPSTEGVPANLTVVVDCGKLVCPQIATSVSAFLDNTTLSISLQQMEDACPTTAPPTTIPPVSSSSSSSSISSSSSTTTDSDSNNSSDSNSNSNDSTEESEESEESTETSESSTSTSTGGNKVGSASRFPPSFSLSLMGLLLVLFKRSPKYFLVLAILSGLVLVHGQPEDCDVDIYVNYPEGVTFSFVDFENEADSTDIVELHQQGAINLEANLTCTTQGNQCVGCCLVDKYSYGRCTAQGCAPLECDCSPSDRDCLESCPTSYNCVDQLCQLLNRTVGEPCDKNIQCQKNICFNGHCGDYCSELPCSLGTTQKHPPSYLATSPNECCQGLSCSDENTCQDSGQTCVEGYCVPLHFNWSPYSSDLGCIGTESAQYCYPANREVEDMIPCSEGIDCVHDSNLYCDGAYCAFKNLDGQDCTSNQGCFSGVCVQNVCQGNGTSVPQVVPEMTCEGNQDSLNGTCLGDPNFYCNNGTCQLKRKNGVVCVSNYECLCGTCNSLLHTCNPNMCVDIETPILLFNGTTVPAHQVQVGDELMGYNGEKNTVIISVGAPHFPQRMVGMNGGPKFFTPAHAFFNPESMDSHVFDAESADDVMAGMVPKFDQMIAGKSVVSTLRKQNQFENSVVNSFEMEDRNASVVYFWTVSDSNIRSYVSHGIVSGESFPLSYPSFYVLTSLIYGKLYQLLPQLMELKSKDSNFSPLELIQKLSVPCTSVIGKYSSDLKENFAKEGLIGEVDNTNEWKEKLIDLAKSAPENKNDRIFAGAAAKLLIPNLNSFSWMDKVKPTVVSQRKIVESLESVLIHFLKTIS